MTTTYLWHSKAIFHMSASQDKPRGDVRTTMEDCHPCWHHRNRRIEIDTENDKTINLR